MPIGSIYLCYTNLYSLPGLLGSRIPCALPPFLRRAREIQIILTQLILFRSAEYGEEGDYGAEEAGEETQVKVEESEAAKAQRVLVEAQKKA